MQTRVKSDLHAPLRSTHRIPDLQAPSMETWQDVDFHMQASTGLCSSKLVQRSNGIFLVPVLLLPETSAHNDMHRAASSKRVEAMRQDLALSTLQKVWLVDMDTQGMRWKMRTKQSIEVPARLALVNIDYFVVMRITGVSGSNGRVNVFLPRRR